jgi:hypothetical protein
MHTISICRQLFYALAPNSTYPIDDPFNPAIKWTPGGNQPPPPGSGFDPVFFDIYPNTDFIPRRDFVNGTAPPDPSWHTSPNTLPTDPTVPYYSARDKGPFYLNNQSSFYQVIQPLNTPTQSSYHNFTLSWLIMSRVKPTTAPIIRKYAGHAGFRVEEGALTLQVDGYDPVVLLTGDVAFIPGGTPYIYYSSAAYTKALHFAAEKKGLDTDLIAKGIKWDSPVWPIS